MEKIIIIGASDQSRHTIDIIEKELKYQIVGVLDKKLSPGQVFEGYDILGYIPEIASLFSEKKISGGIIAIGDNFTRMKVAKEILELVPDFKFITTIHPSAIIGKNVLIGAGSIIMEAVIINNNSIIGDHCNIWTKTSIDHDSEIMNYSSCSPGVTTGGRVIIGECTLIGIGANILHYKNVGNHCVIGGGSLINKDIPDFSVAFGVPAKVIRTRNPGDSYL